jgi:hypothetical protein
MQKIRSNNYLEWALELAFCRLLAIDALQNLLSDTKLTKNVIQQIIRCNDSRDLSQVMQ